MLLNEFSCEPDGAWWAEQFQRVGPVRKSVSPHGGHPGKRKGTTNDSPGCLGEKRSYLEE